MLYSILFSPTGGTKKIADNISEELSEDVFVIDLSKNDEDFSNYKINVDDTVVISMPSFGGRVPQVAIERLKQINSNGARAVLICAYGNRDYEDSLVEMKDVAEELGFNVIAAISAVAEHSIIRKYGANRPDKQDIAQLKEYAQNIKQRIINSEGLSVDISGNRPYRKVSNVGLIPKTTRHCVNCKKCAELCPTGAISKSDVKRIDKNKCISCMRCVSICPNNAKRISKLITLIISFVLKNVCSQRKENELF